MMVDATELANNYRECVRGVWNNYLRQDADMDSVDLLREIGDRLFDEMVLSRLEVLDFKKTSREEPYPFLRSVPASEEIPIMIERPRPTDHNHYYDDPTTRVRRGGATLLFIDFFDFDLLGFRDLQFHLVRVAGFHGQPHLVGRNALVDVHYVQLHFLGAVPSQQG